MTQEQNEGEDAQSPMEVGQQNARAMLSDAVESGAENPTKAAAETAVEQYQQAQEQAQRAQQLADSAAHAASILRTIYTMDGDGLIDPANAGGGGNSPGVGEGSNGKDTDPDDDTVGIDDTSGRVVKGVSEDDA